MLHHLRSILQSSNLCKDALSKKSIEKLKIVIDFSSPNIAKTFHMGNLRGTLMGNFIQKINRCAGHEVHSINYLGDWGKQFAILGVYWNIMKDRPTQEEWQEMSSKEKVRYLTKCYARASAHIASNSMLTKKVHKLFEEMENFMMLNPSSQDCGFPSMQLWKEWCSFSKDYLSAFYKDFGIEFSEWDCESNHVREAQSLVDELLKKKIAFLTPEQLCVVSETKSSQPIVLRKSDESTLYLTRDLGAIHSRHRRFKADRYVYVVDTAQKNHFRQLKSVLNLMNEEELSDKIEHIMYGRVIGLSSRGGRNDSVEYLIEKGEFEAKNYLEQSHTVSLTPEELSDVSKKLSRSIITHESIRRYRYMDYVFSFDNAFNERSAMFLQEKYSRINSMELVNQDVMNEVNARTKDGNFGNLSRDSSTLAVNLADILYEFNEVVQSAYEDSESAKIAGYLMKLAVQSGKAAGRLKVKGEPARIAIPRLMLFAATKKVLGEGMNMLGIEPLKKI